MVAKKVNLIILYLLLLLTGVSQVFSQSIQLGSISGTVKGSDNKSGLPFANIMIVGTDNGTTTDINGKFIIRNIRVGEQAIKISYVGYETKTIKVAIKPNKATEINIVLNIATIEGEEVIVTAQRKGQLDAINQQVNSNTIKNVVASDRLQQNPDANTAEALGRLPGISLNRTGGEGTGIVIRGLDPKYSKVFIDGVALPSTSPDSRSTDISGVSQYLLQGVEVFKSIMPDMDGDATAGAINLKLGGAPEDLDRMKLSVMAQGGYNNLNKYWKNYKFQVVASNRFFDKRLGVVLNISSESVNRSAQKLNATYQILTSSSSSGQLQPLYVNSINLNDGYKLNKRNSGTLIFDYKISSGSKMVFSNFFSDFSSDSRNVSKNYIIPSGSIGYTFNENLGSKSDIFLSSLRSENKFNLFDLDVGLSYSQTHNYIPNSRGWDFRYANGIPISYRDTTSRRMPLETLVSLVKDSISGNVLEKVNLLNINLVQRDNVDRKTETYFDVKIPFNISNTLGGNIKFGAKYKNNYKNKFYSYSAPHYLPAQFGFYAETKLPWIDNKGGTISAKNFEDHVLNGFLNDRFYFGWYPNFERLNQFWEFYKNVTDYYLINPNADNNPYPTIKAYFTPDYVSRQTNNYRFNEDYLGLYIMSEINVGGLVTFIPGVRYEKVSDKLWGWYTYQIPDNTDPTGHAIDSTHNDEYLLPNFHLKIKPATWININLGYTNTLNRPDHYSLVPIVYVNTGTQPQTLTMGNPKLKPEYWSNFDLQVSFFNNEIGYLGITGFYKEVKDMIWSPLKIRVPGDPLVPGFEKTFGENALVDIMQPINHNYTAFIKGIEFEWQTSFWYLPRPLSYFLLNVNYTLMSSSTRYPRAETINTQVGTDSRGRPIYKLLTTYYVDEASVINQPDNIANISLGFSYKDFNVWASYSFTGQKLLNYTQQLEKNIYGLSYSRYDLQVTQKLPVVGMKLIFNLSNINNPTETSKQTGDIRPTYLENYGWTADFGFSCEF